MSTATNNTTSSLVPVDANTPLDIGHLPDDPAVLKHMILELVATLQEERRDKEHLRHRLALLLRRVYGPRQETFHPSQPLLFPDLLTHNEAVAQPSTTPEVEATETKKPRRAKPHGRRQLPDHLPRHAVHHELTEAERTCNCGQVRVDIGSDTSEQLDYKPASLFVWEHHVHKYACPHCAKRKLALPPGTESVDKTLGPIVVSAEKPAMPIEKGLPGPGLLAHLIVGKHVDHLPVYRHERIYERQGVLLSRSTMCDWLAACACLFQPLYQLMVATVLQSRIIHTDDTLIKMQDPPEGETDKGRMWLYYGDARHPYNVFDFTPNRRRDGPQSFLRSYRGYLQADAFSGYDGLYLPEVVDGVSRIVEVACNAHARRKFHESRGSDAVRSHQALAYYGQLYEIERRATGLELDAAGRLRMRQDLAVPILEQYKAWLDRQRDKVLPKSPIAAAIGYSLNQWDALVRYKEDGELAIDNNVSEREMKGIATGRKNWLFVGSVQGGKTAAVLMSLTSTCARLKIEPWAYLQDVLTQLPRLAETDLATLLPDRWQAERQAASSSRPNTAAS